MLSASGLLFLLIATKTIHFEVHLGNNLASQVEVQLLNLGQEVKPIETKKTDTRGRVSFSVDPKKYPQVVGFREESGLSYFSDLIPVAQASAHPYPIRTYSSIAHSPDLKIRTLSLGIDERPTDLFIEETIEVYNPTQFTISGGDPKNEENPEVFRFSLPTGTFNLMYGKGFQRDEVQINGNDILVLSPLTPGRHLFSLQYSLEPAHFSKEVQIQFSIPIQRLEIATEDQGILPKAPFEMAYEGEKLLGEKTQYLYGAENLDLKQFKMRLSGLHANLPISWWAPLAFLILLIAFILLSPLLQFNTEAPDQGKKHKQQALKELRKLEKLHQASLIGSEDYHLKKLRILENLSYYYD